MAAEKFPDVLVRAAKAAGSLLDLARLLQVEPRQVYMWIAGVEQPSAEQRHELERRLSAVLIP